MKRRLVHEGGGRAEVSLAVRSLPSGVGRAKVTVEVSWPGLPNRVVETRLPAHAGCKARPPLYGLDAAVDELLEAGWRDEPGYRAARTARLSGPWRDSLERFQQGAPLSTRDAFWSLTKTSLRDALPPGRGWDAARDRVSTVPAGDPDQDGAIFALMAAFPRQPRYNAPVMSSGASRWFTTVGAAGTLRAAVQATGYEVESTRTGDRIEGVTIRRRPGGTRPTDLWPLGDLLARGACPPGARAEAEREAERLWQASDAFGRAALLYAMPERVDWFHALAAQGPADGEVARALLMAHVDAWTLCRVSDRALGWDGSVHAHALPAIVARLGTDAGPYVSRLVTASSGVVAALVASVASGVPDPLVVDALRRQLPAPHARLALREMATRWPDLVTDRPCWDRGTRHALDRPAPRPTTRGAHPLVRRARPPARHIVDAALELSAGSHPDWPATLAALPVHAALALWNDPPAATQDAGHGAWLVDTMGELALPGLRALLAQHPEALAAAAIPFGGPHLAAAISDLEDTLPPGAAQAWATRHPERARAAGVPPAPPPPPAPAHPAVRRMERRDHEVLRWRGDGLPPAPRDPAAAAAVVARMDLPAPRSIAGPDWVAASGVAEAMRAAAPSLRASVAQAAYALEAGLCDQAADAADVIAWLSGQTPPAVILEALAIAWARTRRAPSLRALVTLTSNVAHATDEQWQHAYDTAYRLLRMGAAIGGRLALACFGPSAPEWWTQRYPDGEVGHALGLATAPDLETFRRAQLASQVDAAALAPYEPTMAARFGYGAKAERRRRTRAPTRASLRLACAPDAGWLAVADARGARLGPASGAGPWRELTSTPTLDVAWGQGGAALALASKDGAVEVVDVASGSVPWRLRLLGARRVAWSGPWLSVLGREEIRTWELGSGAALSGMKLARMGAPATSLAASPGTHGDDPTVWVGLADGRVEPVGVGEHTEQEAWRDAVEGPVVDVAMAPDGRTLVALGTRTVRAFTTAGGKVTWGIELPESVTPVALAAAPAAGEIWVLSDGGGVLRFEQQTGDACGALTLTFR